METLLLSYGEILVFEATFPSRHFSTNFAEIWNCLRNF